MFREWLEYGYDKDIGAYNLRQGPPQEPDWSKAERWQSKSDEFTKLRRELVERLRSHDQGFISLVLVAKSIEQLIDAKLATDAKQHCADGRASC